MRLSILPHQLLSLLEQCPLTVRQHLHTATVLVAAFKEMHWMLCGGRATKQVSMGEAYHLQRMGLEH